MVAPAPPAVRARARGFVPIAGLFLLILLAVPPAGDFPLNDDWIYNASVAQRLETGTDQIDRVATIYLYPQRFYGAALAGQFGFSFSLLRATGLLAGLLALFLAYRLLARLGFSTFACFAGAAVLLANPIFLNLSYTFMTDVPYLVFFLGALLFYLRALQRGSRSDLAAGTLMAILALSQRQIGVLLCPAALACFFLHRRRRGMAPLDWGILLLPVAAFAALTAFRHVGAASEIGLAALLDPRQWARLYQVRPLADFGALTPDRMIDFHRLVLFAVPASLGLFLAPVIAGGLLRPLAALRRLPRPIIPLSVLALGALLAIRASVIDAPIGNLRVNAPPYLTNIWNSCGVGPGPGEVILGDCPPILPPAVLTALTILSIAGGAIVLALALHWMAGQLRRISWRGLSSVPADDAGNDEAPPGAGLVVLAGATQLLPFFIVWPLDRYLVPLLVPGVVILLRTFRRAALSRAVVCLGLLPFLLFGVAAVHDYLGWNKVRWDLGRALVADGVPPAKIEGGLEWVGWHLYFENPPGERGPRVPPLLWYVQDVPNLDPEYLISFSEVPRYNKIAERPVPQWLPGPERRLHVSRRVVP